jgi:hypothetical protein
MLIKHRTFDRYTVTFSGAALISLFLTGCATFLGSGRPVEEKSFHYRISDLAQWNADWVREGDPENLTSDTKGVSDPGADSALADRSYRSEKTGSIITLNTICRPSHASLPKGVEPLRELSRTLFLGISDIKSSSEREIQVQGVTALERTLEGRLQVSPTQTKAMKLQTLVLLHEQCLFDFVLASAPSRFGQDVEAFRRWTESLRFEGERSP